MLDLKNMLWCIASRCIPPALLFACAVHADELVNVDLSISRVYDNNLFRLPDTSDSKTILENGSADDVVNRLGVRLNWDLPFSLQKVTGNAGLVANRFDHNDRLNNDSLDLALGWEGELTKAWKGNGKWRRQRSLASFEDFQGDQRNIVTQDHVEAGLSRQISLNWTVLGYWQHDTSAQSLTSQQYNDRDTASMRLGLSGQSPTGSEMKLFISSRTVDFVNWKWSPGSLQDDGLREDALGFSLKWNITETTISKAEVRVERVTTAHLPQNNFSGHTYDLALAWNGGGALNWQAAVWRSIDSLENFYANYTLRRGGRLAGQWSPRSTWILRTQVSREWLDYQGGNTGLRDDTLDEVSLSLTYMPVHNIEFSSMYSESRRDSSMALNGFHDYTLQLEMKIRWE